MVELPQLLHIVSDISRLAERWPNLPSHLKYFSRSLYERRPKRARSAIMLPYSHARSRPDWAKIVVIGSYRTPFALIEEIAASLAPAVSEFGIVPLIVPMTEKSFEELSWATPIVRAMSRDGSMLFNSERSHDGS